MTTATITDIAADVLAMLADPRPHIEQALQADRKETVKLIAIYERFMIEAQVHDDFDSYVFYADRLSEARAELDEIEARYEGLL